MSLSKRGTAAASTPLRADFALFEAAMENPYHPRDNPSGAIPLCIAENLLSWDQLDAKLRHIAATQPTPEWVASYTSTLGAPPFRETLAAFLSEYLGGDALNPETLAIAAGATATIEMTALLLGDPGDVVVIPAPAYSVYSADIGNKAGMERYDLRVGHLPDQPGVYDLPVTSLDRVYVELGNRFRMLILTQPNNPTGQVYLPEQLYAILNWCEEHRVHLVVNEIYALSLIDQDHPDLRADYPAKQHFSSCLGLLEERRSDYFHWWWSFSKDFGISGLRVGVLYTKNQDLTAAWANYGAPSISSNYVQWLLSEVLTDRKWTRKFLRQKSLTESYATVIRTLRKLSIPYVPAVGSLFVWFDLSEFLTAATEEAAVELWTDLFEQSGLLLTGPTGMGAEPGWFRLVYSGVDQPTLAVAMDRFYHYFRSFR